MQLVLAEHPGIVVEEAEPAVPGRRDVASLVQEEEEALVLENERILHSGPVAAVHRWIAYGRFHRYRYRCLCYLLLDFHVDDRGSEFGL
jgi:hypothetical protein